MNYHCCWDATWLEVPMICLSTCLYLFLHPALWLWISVSTPHLSPPLPTADYSNKYFCHLLLKGSNLCTLFPWQSNHPFDLTLVTSTRLFFFFSPQNLISFFVLYSVPLSFPPAVTKKNHENEIIFSTGCNMNDNPIRDTLYWKH
jgi:hypothetical protein